MTNLGARIGDGVDLISEERVRQLTAGWTPAHDDSHDDGALAAAAACLAGEETAAASSIWPDDDRSWIYQLRAKHAVQGPRDSARWTRTRVRQLVIAGALIAAEIDRLERRARPLAAYDRAQAVDETHEAK
jgi:hypothetical protein